MRWVKTASFDSKNPDILVFVLCRRLGVIQNNHSRPIRKTGTIGMDGCWHCVVIEVDVVRENYDEIDICWRRGRTDALKPLPVAFYSLILRYGNTVGGYIRRTVCNFHSATRLQTDRCLAFWTCATVVQRSDEARNQ